MAADALIITRLKGAAFSSRWGGVVTAYPAHDQYYRQLRHARGAFCLVRFPHRAVAALRPFTGPGALNKERWHINPAHPEVQVVQANIATLYALVDAGEVDPAALTDAQIDQYLVHVVAGQVDIAQLLIDTDG